MKLEYSIIDCTENYPDTNRRTPFRIARYTFNYAAEDTVLIEDFVSKGLALAKQVNPGGANDSANTRSFESIQNNCVAGIVSEFAWKHFLNQDRVIVAEPKIPSKSAQIDLEIISNNKKIEVRSSFPRNGIEFAICNCKFEFDIIGPYSNNYKPAEVQKDYYLRVLFHLQKGETIIERIKQNNFQAFLTGGATWEMMMDADVSINKDLIPDGGTSLSNLGVKSSYRVVPFSKALDTKEISELICE